MRALKLLLLLAGLFAAGGLVSWEILTNPGNPLVRWFSGSVATFDAPVVVGPYPLEDDFRRLKGNDVRVVVSLLDPDIPYERVLLNREKKLELIARQSGGG